ncbi:hypothetical protein Q3G72_032324 [Acer saccharum]|nr:hypothetical protein Q3G72_032324 [Acer saccharum]
MGDALFSILIDESHDVSTKEQMAIVLHYVNPIGQVVEWFIGIKHIASTTALSLKATIDNIFSGHGLSISRLCEQGYDGASNMQGEFNGLKSLIMKENECAYYIHCFAHQLQLALVALAKKHVDVQSLFNIVANVVNIVGASPKRRDILWDKQAMVVFEAIKNGELSNGRGLNQETNLKRFGDTLWGSHYGTLISIITMFPSLIDVLEIIADDGSTSEQRCEANYLVELMQSFNFVFCLHLMKDVLGITNELSQALQRKDQDIVNAMKLVSLYMQLQELNSCFNETNTELLVCLACLSPSESYSAFDKEKLIRLAQFYPKDFSPMDLMILDCQLKTYIMDMRSSVEFLKLNGITELAKMMVASKKDKIKSKMKHGWSSVKRGERLQHREFPSVVTDDCISPTIKPEL